MRNLWKLIRFVKPYWKKSLLSLFLLIAVVVMDLAIPRLIQHIIDEGISRQDGSVVIETSLVMLVISALNMLLAIGNNVFSVQVGEGVARDLREALFLKIQSFSFGDLDHLKTGQLLVRLTSDASVFQRLVQVSLRIGTRAPMLMVGSIILMFNTDRSLALTMLPIVILTALILGFFIARMGDLLSSALKKLDALNNVLQENIAGVRVVKSFVRAQFEEERFGTANTDFTNRHILVMRFMSTMSPALTVFLNIGIVVVIWSGGLQAIRGEMSTGQIVAFVNYLQTTMGPLMIMVMLANVIAAGIASAERVNEVLELDPEVQDLPGASPLPAANQYRVEFDSVRFHYDGTNDQPVLEQINLVAEPGTTTAILGATGAGKTTLVNLIPRFYDPVEGSVLINGVDVRQVTQDTLLSLIGVVPQDTVLFSGSVSDNIRYGRPEASEDEVIEAAKAAQAHTFILELPDGYDTQVSQRGVNLSGGQKQRIAIARALLTRPGILILDDSTSSVDVETETKIQSALEQWQPGRTNFVVAQRISTVLKADKIVVIDNGRIAAEGKHADLLRTSPIYREIYNSQLGSGVKGMEEALSADAVSSPGDANARR